MKALISVFLLNLLCFTASYKILVMYPLPIRSINILGKGVVESLLKDGHEVTYITAFPIDRPQSKNFRQIDVSQTKLLLAGDASWSLGNMVGKKRDSEIYGIQSICVDTARAVFQYENVAKLLQDPNEHFDVVVADLMESEVYAGLAVLYQCPLVWVFSMGAHWQVVQLIADPSNPAYDTDYYGSTIPPLSFTQRVQELYSRIKWTFSKRFYIAPAELQLYKETFGPLLAKRGLKLPDYDEVIYNSSMIFGNEHNAVAHRPSTPQNFKYIGGIHIDDPVKPLPKNLQELMDNAKHGVIYFSMGSFLQSKEFPEEFKRELLKIFGELKETVLWKFEENLKNLPKNVHIVQWAPQQSILNHPNCKFFISHGGLLSSIESVHFGVPTIGIPVLLDQLTNVLKAVANGYAIKVDLDQDFTANLKIAINTILSDDSYRKRIKEFTHIYHSHPMKPSAEVAYWVRHVVETGGARYLRSPAINVPLYQRLYLDLLALVVGIIIALYWALNKVLGKSVTKPQKKKLH